MTILTPQQATEDANIHIEGSRKVGGRSFTQEACSYQLRKGDSVVIDLASMGMQPETFPIPNVFCPERCEDSLLDA